MNLRNSVNTLPTWVKGTILTVLIGAIVGTGLSVYIRHQTNRATQLQIEADRLRGEAEAARKDALAYKEKAGELQAALDASLVNSAKLKKELDKIKVPEPPGPAPQYVSEIVADLQKWGLNPLTGASNVVGRSAFGVRKDETQIIWKWGADAQRVPALEFKLQKTTEFATSVTADRDLAIKLAETRTLEATKWQTAADTHRNEADTIRKEVTALQKSMAAEKKRRWIYVGAAAVLSAVATKQLAR